MYCVPDYYQLVKDGAETLSFIATIAVAFFAFRALRQIRIAQLTLKVQSTREARRIAIEQSEKYAAEVIEMVNKITSLQRKGEYPIFTAAKVTKAFPNVTVTTEKATVEDMLQEARSNDALVLNMLNKMEGIAMYFMSGVADETVAFRPVAPTFCETVVRFLPVLVALNHSERLYTNTLSLWRIWQSRLEKEQTQRELDGAAKEQASGQEKVQKAREKMAQIQIPEIKPLGTDEKTF